MFDMRKVFGVLLGALIFLQPSDLRAQDTLTTSRAISGQSALNRLAGNNGIGSARTISEIPLPEKRTLGTNYLNEQWQDTNIALYEGNMMIERCPMKYDIKLNELDIKTNTVVKALDGGKVRSFAWKDSESGEIFHFTNGKNLDPKLMGMFQVLAEGNMIFVKRTELVVKKADYNVQLNVGDQNDHIVKNDKFYFFKEKGLVPLPKNKAKFLEVFGQYKDAVRNYMKANSLGISKQQDLVMIANYYNTLNGI
jgi:hypothetical protein